MNAYLPTDIAVLSAVLAILVLVLLVGYLLGNGEPARWRRPAAWLHLVGWTVWVERFTADQPPGFRMLALCLVMIVCLKAVVLADSRLAGEPPLSPLRWLCFAALWVGMRPAVFARRTGRTRADAGRVLRWASGWLVLGLACLLLARQLRQRTPDAGLLAVLCLLVGLSLVLHFGLLNMLAAWWRRQGFDCRPLMRTPLAARSLGEFWSRRWNLAFSEMAALSIFRPLVRWLGRPGAVLAGFLASGVLHELAISVPVRAGFGLPMLYFTLHGGLVLAEQALARLGWSIDRAGGLAHLWTISWLLLPLPLLFHPWFVDG
ncbi:MAG: hypothetical protein JNM56_21795, partial [Planctomycetia bacterium]|nr:hypothetical protein [Planctomycetia bacterium]